MNTTETQTLSIDPRTFAQWVRKVALINEQFSEVLHDTADIVAGHDPHSAIGLYQAADVASQTVQRLRQSIPEPMPIIKEKTDSKRLWFVLGMLVSAFIAWI